MPFILDFSKPGVFSATNNRLVKMAIKIDDALVNNANFITAYDIIGLDEKKDKLSAYPEYNDFRKVIVAMKNYLGDNLETQIIKGNLKGFRYAENLYGQSECNRNPFGTMRKVTKNISLNEFVTKLKGMIDFIPEILLNNIFQGTNILLELEGKATYREDFISPETPFLLSGIEYLPEIYSAIERKKVLWLRYSRRYKSSIEQRLHPHYLKEYNGRWYVCGTIEIDSERKSNLYENALIALDRIEDLDEIEESFIDVKKGHYKDYFKDIIGVTHQQDAKTEHITLKVTNPYVFNLLKTKKLHSSQEEEIKKREFFIHLKLKPNRELITKILSYGKALQVVSPVSLRDKIVKEIEGMISLYE